MPASVNVLEKAPMVEDALHEASRIKSVVTDAITDAVKDGVRVANRQIRRGRYAAEDALEEAKHVVRRRPIAAMVVIFAAGVLAGGILACIALPRR